MRKEEGGRAEMAAETGNVLRGGIEGVWDAMM
jgi:hypothetical protein